MKSPKRIPAKELEILKTPGQWDMKKLLDQQTRVVKWLYNNCNKRSEVIDEKLVRLIVHHYEVKLQNLKAENTKLMQLAATA